MKKFVAILAVLMIAILALVPMTVAGAEGVHDRYIVSENGKTVNLRNRPDGTVLSRLGVGKTVTLLEDPANGWAHVSTMVGGKTLKGYVQCKFLCTEDPATAPQTFVKVKNFQVTIVPRKGENGHANLRKEPSFSATIKRYLQMDDVVTVLAESNAWYQVRTAAGTTGYVVKAVTAK